MDDKKGQNTDKPECKYGKSCYRKNPEHLEQFSHPSPEPSKRKGLDVETNSSKVSPPSKVAKIDREQFLLVVTSSSESESEPEECVQVHKVEKSPRSAPPENIRDYIKEVFLVEMPSDFYDFWEFCQIVNKKEPAKAFSEALLHLVGPYDILSKKISHEDITSENILCHWRYYFDPPEFQTVIKKDGVEGYHIGYFRDDPHEMPFGLASNVASEGCKLKLVGDNIFCAINQEISTFIEKTSKKPLKDKFTKMLSELCAFAKKKQYSLNVSTPKTKARTKNVVSKTFHGLGIVVPIVRDVGYRPLSETDASLQAILRKISSCETKEAKLTSREALDELLTFLQFANDECDYGMGLELGIDLFCFGDPYFHSDVLSVLPLAYELLKRNEYAQIIRSHLRNRRKGNNLSIKPTKSSKITNFFTSNK